MSKTSLKKALCAVMALTMSTSLLAACGNNKTGGVGEVDEEGNVTLTFTHWENEDTSKAMRKAFDEVFEVDHSNIKVEMQAAPLGDYGTKISQMIASGTAPDVFQLGHDMGVTFFQNKLLYDFTEYANKETDLESKYAENTYSLWRFADGDKEWSGKTFGLPGLLNVYGIFYNKDLLSQAGLAEPTDDWTWDDLENYATTLVESGVSEYGLYGMGNDIFHTGTRSVSEGGAPLTDQILEPTAITMDDTFKATAERIKKMVASKAFTPPTYEAQNIQDIFRQGQIPMLFYGQWQIADFINNPNPDLNWDYVALPSGSAGRAMMYDCTGWGANINIKAPDEVWELMKFCSGDMYSTVLADQPVAASAYTASADAFYNAVTEGGHEKSANAVKAMIDDSQKTVLRFYPNWKDNANKVVSEKWNNILTGDLDISEIDNIVSGVNEVIANAQ